jgi:hypothetical protein
MEWNDQEISAISLSSYLSILQRRNSQNYSTMLSRYKLTTGGVDPNVMEVPKIGPAGVFGSVTNYPDLILAWLVKQCNACNNNGPSVYEHVVLKL